jgi:UDP-N-acetylmuramyl pentapeptide phosphotransferase/UDP-N-acetylglucosamine-1-phosphate transferase
VITLLVTAVAAAVIARTGLRALPTRPNFRGEQLPFPAGALAIATTVLLLGPMFVIDQVEDTELWFILLGVALLGLLDDLLAGEGRGLRGHARALLRGHFSTGMLKALGTLSLGVAYLSERYVSSEWRNWLCVLVLLLSTNLGNLLDLRPGRTTKGFLLFLVGMLVFGRTLGIEIVAPFAGPVLLFGLLDLRERCMLGDTGANLLGACVGIYLVIEFETKGLAVSAAILLALTIFGEFRSFSAAIDRIPPLRALDSLGRKSHA